MSRSLLGVVVAALVLGVAAIARAEVVTLACDGLLFKLDYGQRTVTYDGFTAPVEVTEDAVTWSDGRRTIGRLVVNRFSGEWRTYRLDGRPLQSGTCQVGGRKF